LVSSIQSPPDCETSAPVASFDFDSLILQQRVELKRYAERRMSAQLRVRVDASDVVQETCLRAYRELEQFRGQSREEFLAWVYRIHSRNISRHVEWHATTLKRDLKREVRVDSHACGDSRPTNPVFVAIGSTPSAHLHRSEQAQLLHCLLRELTADFSTVLRLRVSEGLPFEDIGRRMSRSSGAVRKLYSRARHELMRLIREREGRQ